MTFSWARHARLQWQVPSCIEAAYSSAARIPQTRPCLQYTRHHITNDTSWRVIRSSKDADRVVRLWLVAHGHIWSRTWRHIRELQRQCRSPYQTLPQHSRRPGKPSQSLIYLPSALPWLQPHKSSQLSFVFFMTRLASYLGQPTTV